MVYQTIWSDYWVTKIEMVIVSQINMITMNQGVTDSKLIFILVLSLTAINILFDDRITYLSIMVRLLYQMVTGLLYEPMGMMLLIYEMVTKQFVDEMVVTQSQ
jgi:hypothetical protein